MPIGTTRGKIIPKSYFGMHVNNALPQAKNPYNGRECPLFTDIGYGTIRFWDGYVVHRLVNTANGVYDWTALDYRVAAAEAAGLDIIYTFGAMPDWATTAPGPYPNYNPNPPTQMSYLSTFVTEVATRYSGRIKYYEIWNEVDSPGSWVGTISQMISQGQAIYTAVKAADPSATVLSPNTISWGSLNNLIGMAYLDVYLASASTYCDAIAMHLYTDPSQPETYYTLCRAYKNLADKYGKTSVICTETGVLTYYSSSGVLKDPKVNGAGDLMDEDQGASWVTRIMLMGWLGGLDCLCYYLMDNTNNTMAINLTNYLPAGPTASVRYKPMAAYKYISTLLTGGTLSGFKQKGYQYEADFSTKEGKFGKVVWCSDYKTATYDLTGNSSAYTCTGDTVTISSNYTLTNTPVFIFR